MKALKSKYGFALCLALLISLLVVSAAWAQSGMRLSMRRDFGYASGASARIQGTFTLTAEGDVPVQRVVFLIDGASMGEDSEAPYQLRFTTDNYALGQHSLTAVGYTAGGEELRSNEIWAIFVTADEGWKAGLTIAGPILLLVFGAMLLSALISIPANRKLRQLPPGTPRSYGPAGGTICKRCARPFPRHVLSPNMVLGKLERCPYCGKWQIAPGQSIPLLRAAEAAEIEDAQAGQADLAEDETERLRKEIENSRYV